MTAAAERDRWEARYKEPDYDPDREPTAFLVDATQALIPGRALCLAAGAGRNAVHLATQGWTVTATDISETGLHWCRRWATDSGVDVDTVVADLAAFDPPAGHWDLVTMVSYLQPDLFAAIRRTLRPSGHFLFHTFSQRHLEQGWGPRSPTHLADPEKVRAAFRDWDLVRFEEGVYPRSDGRREAVLRMLARKPT